MAKYFDNDEIKESSSEKKVRIFLAVMYFIQVLIMVGLPLMYGTANDEGQYATLTAVNLMIQPNGYNSSGEIFVALFGVALVILPIVAFFFFLLDKKSKKKYVVSYITVIINCIIICFSIGVKSLYIGGVLSLIAYVVILFMTTQGLQATRMRERDTASKETETNS